jgi:hypothetical protein
VTPPRIQQYSIDSFTACANKSHHHVIYHSGSPFLSLLNNSSRKERRRLTPPFGGEESVYAGKRTYKLCAEEMGGGVALPGLSVKVECHMYSSWKE